MKTEAQIKARLAELRQKLLASAGEPVAVVYRLQGNIGALEWALRTDEESEAPHPDPRRNWNPARSI